MKQQYKEINYQTYLNNSIANLKLNYKSSISTVTYNEIYHNTIIKLVSAVISSYY